MSLSIKEVRDIALLGRLELDAAELETMARHLGAIIEYVNQLQQVNTEGVEPMAHPLPIQNVFRDDEPAPSLTVAEALANAPHRHGDFYAVPAVLE